MKSNEEPNDVDFLISEETRYEKDTARVVSLKDSDAATRRTRCDSCWKTPLTCICRAIDVLRASAAGICWRHKHRPFRFLIYMSREEWRCGGNSGKALHLLFPDETKLFVHGLRDDAVRLREEVVKGNINRTCILFPGPSALSVPQWLARGIPHATGDVSTIGELPSQDPPGDIAQPSAGSICNSECVTIILVDGTWRQARRMSKVLGRRIIEFIPQVALSLAGENRKSVFHRKQSEEGRICTAEALSLAVREVLSYDVNGGNFAEVSDSDLQPAGALNELVVQAIHLGNRAIAPTRLEHNWKGNGGHPAWYYGVRLVDGRIASESAEPETRECVDSGLPNQEEGVGDAGE